MSVDPTQALIAQFSGFVSSKDLSDQDWQLITKEFGVYDIATDVDRFFKSWYFNDDDKPLRTSNFFEKVYKEDEKLAISIMGRVYQKIGGADESDFIEYPALKTINSTIEDGSFANSNFTYHTETLIDIPNTPDAFYPDLIEEINVCYRNGAYTGSLILSRKLLENEVIEVLRARFGIENGRHLFFDENTGQFLSFNILIENLKKELEHFEPLSDAADEEIIRKLHNLRHHANAGTHSLEKEITTETVEEQANNIERISTVLFDLRKKSLDADPVMPSVSMDSEDEQTSKMSPDLFTKSDSEILSEYAEEMSQLFHFSESGEVYIKNESGYLLRQKVKILFIAKRYGTESEVIDSPVVSINEIIDRFNLDMSKAWDVIDELTCIKDIDRGDGEFELDVQQLPDIVPIK